MGIKRHSLTRAITLAIAVPGVSICHYALAQDNIEEIQEIVVTGTNVYRDRTDDINPTLSYSLDFFQRFEPLTVGEMLKRTPGVVFTSDVLEFDAVQLRGLSAEYTQILVNGRPIPGQGADRTFFVDRIPAELVESIEIIRSPSADMTSEGAAGSLNVILKDGAQLEGIVGRIGATHYGDDDDELRGLGSLAVAGAGNGSDYWFGVNIQERRNPKEKVEEFFDEGELEGFAFEDDTRDGTDSSLNGSVGFALPQGDLRLNGFYVLTDREEIEFVDEFEGATIDPALGTLVQREFQNEEIDQTSWGIDGVYTVQIGSGELLLSAAISTFDEDSFTFETEEEFEDGISQGIEEDEETIDIDDDSVRSEVAYTLPVAGIELKGGVAYSSNDRTGLQAGFFDIEADISETVIAPYLMFSATTAGGISVQGGARWDDYEREVFAGGVAVTTDSDELLPSLSIRWDATANDRFIASVARTMRRPEFDFVTPFEEEEEPDDEDITIGNPNLGVELSTGFDIGYEHRFANAGMAGINYFYRDISDVIELTATGPFAAGGSVFQPLNIGDGETWGLEFDLSTPLDFMGLDNTGFYANYAYMDSDIIDPFTGTERKFRNQPDFVYNVSLTQDFPAISAGAGISFQKRGDSLETEFEEYVTTEYDGNLEAFFEMNFGDSTVVRLSGTNLLDQEKLEFIRDFGEIVNEIQREQSSRTFTVTVRSTF